MRSINRLIILTLFFQLMSGSNLFGRDDVYRLPFASSGNIIELAIANRSHRETNVTVRLENAPTWLRFLSTEQSLEKIEAQAEGTAGFTFSVNQSAPVGQTHLLRFVITSASGQTWTKQLSIVVSPPEQFEVFQNYPNPFNPTTAISYQLSSDSRVRVAIFNLLGQEVAVLVDEDRPAGFHSQSWNASAFPSGMYIYQLTAQTGDDGRRTVRKTMMLIK